LPLAILSSFPYGYLKIRPADLEAKNTAALFAAQVVVTLLSLILSIFIARNLSAVISGRYSFAVFSDLGYNTLLIREVTRDKISGSKSLFKQQTKMC